MTEMIERVAKAIATYWEREGFDPSEPSEGAARAAIEAMREPTQEMLEVGGTNLAGEDRMDVAESWPLMIDAALGVTRIP